MRPTMPQKFHITLWERLGLRMLLKQVALSFSVSQKLGRNSVKSFISYWIPILHAINVLLLWFVLLNLCDGYGTGHSASLFLPIASSEMSFYMTMASKRLRSATKVRNIQNRKPNPSIWFHAQVLWWIGEKDFVKSSGKSCESSRST